MAHNVIEVVDENDQPIGALPKEEVWAKGLLHRIVRIMVEDDRGRILLQKRSAHMDTFPNCWDHSAAGHVDPGETYEQAAVCETAEEIGLENIELKHIGTWRSHDTVDGRILNRINKLYRAKVKSPKLVLQESEVTDVEWFTPDEIRQLVKNHPDQVTDGLTKVISDYY